MHCKPQPAIVLSFTQSWSEYATVVEMQACLLIKKNRLCTELSLLHFWWANLSWYSCKYPGYCNQWPAWNNLVILFPSTSGRLTGRSQAGHRQVTGTWKVGLMKGDDSEMSAPSAPLSKELVRCWAHGTACPFDASLIFPSPYISW